MSWQYNIVMHTPLGKKYGTLFADVTDNTVSGWLDILKHKERFEGTIDSDGNCTISGTIVTLMRSVKYTATGKMTSTAVALKLQGERNVFELTGVACQKGENT
ncbi:MAG: hypothetical protein ACI396_02530 [Acutalibacteraceae bacterium]